MSWNERTNGTALGTACRAYSLPVPVPVYTLPQVGTLGVGLAGCCQRSSSPWASPQSMERAQRSRCTLTRSAATFRHRCFTLTLVIF